MTPVDIFLILIALVVAFIVMAFLSNSIKTKRDFKKEKTTYESGRKICIHTLEDCENCIVAGKCVQREGKGLLGKYSGKE